MSQFGLFTALIPHADIRILVLIPMVSRCCSALAVTCLPPMSTSQYADKKNPVSQKIFLTVLLLAALAAGVLWTGWTALALLGGLAGHALALRRAYKSLEGMNGDISGYALTCSELAALAVLAII